MSAPEAAISRNGVHLLVSIWILQGLAAVFLALRMYCKFHLQRRLWWDDFVLIASWVFLLVSAISSSVNVHLGFGLHFIDVDLGNLDTMNVLSIISGFTSVVSAVASKLSFGITLVRLSDGWLRRIIWLLMFTIFALFPVATVSFFGSCNPPAKIFNHAIEGTCWSAATTLHLGIALGSYMAACDFMLAMLPWKILMRVHMMRQEKVGVAVAMSMGIFAGATAIVKCVKLPLLVSEDFTYDGTPFVIWGFAECAVSIMAASIPAMRALVMTVCGPRSRNRSYPSATAASPANHPHKGSERGTRDTITSYFRRTSSDSGKEGLAGRGSELRGQTSISLDKMSPALPYGRNQNGQNDPSERIVRPKKGEASTSVTDLEASDAGESLPEHGIGMGAQRDSYRLQDV